MFRLLKSFNVGFFLLYTALVFLPESVFAAVEMDEVVVEASKIDAADPSANDRSAFVTVINSENFEKTSKTFSNVIEETVGLNVRKFGGDGSYSTASIRGSSASQVTILIDGIPLNRGKAGVVNLGNISLANVEKIEVYRGASPLKFRASSIGGVINIVTKNGGEKPENSASVTYGSFNSYDLKLLKSEKIKNTSYLISTNVNGSDGDFEFLNDKGTPINYSDDEIVKRENNDHISYDIFGKVKKDLSEDLWLDVSVNYFNKKQGIAGTTSNHALNTSLDTERTILNTRLKRENFINQGDSGELAFWVLNEETWFNDEDGEMGIGNQNNHSKNIAIGIDSVVSHYAGDYNLLTVLLSVQHEYFDSKDSVKAGSGQDGTSQKRTLYQAGLSDEIILFDDRLSLVPMIMYSYYDNDFGGEVSFQTDEVPEVGNDDSVTLKFGSELMLSDSFFVKANIGKYYRFPNFSELFGDEGAITGNPELTPETGINADVGLRYKQKDFGRFSHIINNISAECVFFHNTSDDLILFFQTSQSTIRAENISKTRITGIETSIDLTFYNHFHITGNLTYNNSENISELSHYNGKQLPGLPEFDSALKFEVFNDRVRAFYEFNYMSESYMTAYNDFLHAERKLHNLGAIYNMNKKMTVSVEAENLTDNQVLDVKGFPLPGRSFSSTIQIKF